MKKPLRAFLLTLMITSVPVFAAAGAEGEGTGLVTKLFLGFFAMIIVCQLVPGLAMFGSMVKGLFRQRGAIGQKKGSKSVHAR